MRYIVRRIRGNGRPVVGTIDTLVREYANDKNAIRYMHRHLDSPHFTPGQYLLSTYPEHGTNGRPAERDVAYLYKQAPMR